MPAASEGAIAFEELVVDCTCCPATCVEINNADFLGMAGGDCYLYGFGRDPMFDTIYGYYNPFRDIRSSMNISAGVGINYQSAYNATGGAILGDLYATEADAISQTSPIGEYLLSFTFDCFEDQIRFNASLIDGNGVEPSVAFPERIKLARDLPGTFALVDPTSACPSFTIQLGTQIPPI
jgi:hypothetical protein